MDTIGGDDDSDDFEYGNMEMMDEDSDEGKIPVSFDDFDNDSEEEEKVDLLGEGL